MEATRLVWQSFRNIGRHPRIPTKLRITTFLFSLIVCSAHFAAIWIVIRLFGEDTVLAFCLAAPVFFGISVTLLTLLLEREHELADQPASRGE